MSRCQQRLPTGRTENFVRAIFYIFNSIKGNDFGKKGPMMLLKSLNYAIDSIQGEKSISTNSRSTFRMNLKTFSRIARNGRFSINFSIVFSRIYGDGIMCLSVREEKNAIRIDGWTKLFLETIVYNLIEDFSRNFYPIVHNWKEKKNISLMHVPSSSYQLEETRTFKSRCKSEKGNVSSS